MAPLDSPRHDDDGHLERERDGLKGGDGASAATLKVIDGLAADTSEGGELLTGQAGIDARGDDLRGDVAGGLVRFSHGVSLS